MEFEVVGGQDSGEKPKLPFYVERGSVEIHGVRREQWNVMVGGDGDEEKCCSCDDEGAALAISSALNLRFALVLQAGTVENAMRLMDLGAGMFKQKKPNDGAVFNLGKKPKEESVILVPPGTIEE